MRSRYRSKVNGSNSRFIHLLSQSEVILSTSSLGFDQPCFEPASSLRFDQPRFQLGSRKKLLRISVCHLMFSCFILASVGVLSFLILLRINRRWGTTRLILHVGFLPKTMLNLRFGLHTIEGNRHTILPR